MSESGFKTIDPEIEPEYVGVHSALNREQCQHWVGDSPENVERCENNATHTVVIFDGSDLIQMGSCDNCGEPDELPSHDREWTGEVSEE